MIARALGLVLSLVAAPWACAAEGLLAPSPDSLWLGLRARITVQTAAVSPLSLTGLADGGQRGLQGGAVLGDYFFARPSFGGFRATSGVLMGSQAGAPLLAATAGPRLGLAVTSGTNTAAGLGSENWAATPYLGLGFNSETRSGGLSLSADLGWVAEGVATGGSLDRALLGIQGADSARRELRLSPMLQVGVRYAF
ncbi:MAG: hypothetical protein H7Z19_09970 [Chitinophagaceae bacterium]|nr:hypothetical protein [Rubrivivax sp.]